MEPVILEFEIQKNPLQDGTFCVDRIVLWGEMLGLEPRGGLTGRLHVTFISRRFMAKMNQIYEGFMMSPFGTFWRFFGTFWRKAEEDCV